MSKAICAKCIAEGSVEEALLAQSYENGYNDGTVVQKKHDDEYIAKLREEACKQFRFILGKVCDPLICDSLEEDFRNEINKL